MRGRRREAGIEADLWPRSRRNRGGNGTGVWQGSRGVKAAKARRGEPGADGSDISRPAIGWAQARGDRENGGTRENVIGEFGLFADEGAKEKELVRRVR